MAFTLYSLLEAGLLIVNAIAILNKDRFLSRIGWTHEQYRGFGESVDSNSTKSKLINLIASVQTVMRVPLIFINAVVIVAKLIIG